MNLVTPNRLTLLRIFLLPFPCFFLLSQSSSGKIWALVTGFLLGITDYFDGILARKNKKITSIGTILDPVADKIFVSSIYLILVYLNYFPFLPVFLIILREILISFLRSWFPDKLKVSILTKLKTFFQMSFAGITLLCYLYFPGQIYLIDYVLWVIVIFSYISAIPYFYKVFVKIKEFKKNLKNFFISISSLLYPVSLISVFPLTQNLFWINTLALSFFFFKKGLVKSSPKLSSEKCGLSLFVIGNFILEYIYFKKLFFSLWIVLIISFLRDGIKSLKIMWKILKIQ